MVVIFVFIRYNVYGYFCVIWRVDILYVDYFIVKKVELMFNSNYWLINLIIFLLWYF